MTGALEPLPKSPTVSVSATQFVGLSAPGNSNGFFTGLMTEQYHNSVYTGNEQKVLYTDTTFALSSAYLWIDEYNVNNFQSQFSGTSGVISFASNPKQLQSYSLDGATASANANDFITGSVSVVQFTLSYSVTGGGTGYSAPIFSYLSDGLQQSATLTTSPTVYSVDSGTSWTVTNPLSGSSTSERWMTNQTSSGTASSLQTISFAYGHEYFIDFNSNPSSEGSTSPSGFIWYNSGQTYSIIATPINPYLLASWTVTAPLVISDIANPSSPSTTILISGSGTVTANFATISINLNSPANTITQGASIHLSGTAKGTGGSATISVSGLPSGATSSLSSNQLALTISGAQFTLTIATTYAATVGTFTVTITSAVSGVGSTSTQYALTIRQAIPLALGFSISGGGTGYSAPTISYVYNGTSSQVSLNSAPGIVYADLNSRWNATSVLSGSSSTERWETNQTTSGSALSAATINFVYYHQFFVAFSYSVLGGGSGYSAPSVAAVQFGSKVSPTLGQKTWIDEGSQYSYSNPLTGSTQSERWEASNSSLPSGQISSSAQVSPVYYHQFAVNAGFVIVNGGSPPSGPTFTSKSLGSSRSTALTTNVASYWTDAGSNYNFSASIAATGERWITNSSTVGTVTSQISVIPTYDHQYYLTLEPSVQAGGTVNPANAWINAGNSISISNTPSLGWKFEFWSGSGSGSYTGSANTTTVTLESPIVENATFYTGFAITATGSGSISYSFGSTLGSVAGGQSRTIYVPAGTSVTLNANPSSFLSKLDSWTGAVSGSAAESSITVTSPTSVQAQFAYNFVNIGIMTVVIVIGLIAVVLVIVRRPTKP